MKCCCRYYPQRGPLTIFIYDGVFQTQKETYNNLFKIWCKIKSPHLTLNIQFDTVMTTLLHQIPKNICIYLLYLSPSIMI